MPQTLFPSCKSENKIMWPQIFPLTENSSQKNVAASVFCHCVLNIKSAAGSCFHLCKHTKKTSVVTRVFSLFTRNVRQTILFICISCQGPAALLK